MKLVNANPNAAVSGGNELPGKVNYFLGNDPGKWHTSVPTYAKVRYTGIYPGIDLVYYGNPSADGQLEYDFVVAPGADPGVIALDVAAGLSRHPSSKSGGIPIRSGQVPPPLQIAADGDVVIKTDGGEIRFHKPVVYQGQDSGFRIRDSGAKNPQQPAASNRKSPITNRKSIGACFRLDAQNRIHFALGAYDHTRPLVIDPVLAYSTFLGGSGGGDAGNAIAVDTAGNVYVAGGTRSVDFPVTQGAFQTANQAVVRGGNAFVTKLNPTGTALVYSTYLGGSGGDGASAITVDTAGNAYVAGETYSTDFPVTQGAFQTTNKAAANGNDTAFVAKLNPTGTALVYSTYLGGSAISIRIAYFGDQANAIAVDAAGDAYVAGETYSVDFPVTAGAFQTTNRAGARGLWNAFVTTLNPAGTALVYSTYLGGSGSPGVKYAGDAGNAIAVDTAGNVYVAGQTYSPDFPVTSGAYQTTNHAAARELSNVFVTKLSPAGTALVYSTFLGGGGRDIGSAIAVDTAGNVYVAGQTSSTDFPVTQGAFQTTNHVEAEPPLTLASNAFITKLDPAGTALVYSTYLGGSGRVNQVDIPDGDLASGLAFDSSGNAYVTGSTGSVDFPTTPGAYQMTNHRQCMGGWIGCYNAFITELNPTGSALLYSTYLGGEGTNPGEFTGSAAFRNGDQANALALDNSGNVYVTGSAPSYDFPVTAGAFQTMVNSLYGNAFVTELNMAAPSTATTPTVTVTPTSSTITSGQPLAVRVSVSGGSANPQPTGTVALASRAYASAATTLSGGSATIDIPGGSLLAITSEVLTTDVLAAKYIPDAASSSAYNFSSGVGSVTVVGLSISVTPSSSALTSAQAQSQPLAVAVVATAGAGNPTPTGTVTLTTGSWSSAATALLGGNAAINIPSGTLTIGSNALNVSYSGDSNYPAVATAATAVVTVSAATVAVVPSSSSINSAQALPVTITVSAGSGNPTPTGTVTLSCGSAYASLVTPLTGGSATITIPAGTLPPGVDTLEASYAGGNYLPASGQASVTVAGFTIAGTAVTVYPGPIAMSTITVTPAGGFTGSVALTAAITSSPGGAQSLPTLSFGGTSRVSITGATGGIATLTISTTAANSCPAAILIRRRVPWYPPPCTPTSGTTPGNYTITVTGTSDTTVATGIVALTVE
jgi:hypothetical protein